MLFASPAMSSYRTAGGLLSLPPARRTVRGGRCLRLLAIAAKRARRAYQTVGRGADQILSVGEPQRLSYQGRILRLGILQKCALHLLFTIIAADVDLLPRQGMNARRVHNG